jgi:chromosome segregation ATPase
MNSISNLRSYGPGVTHRGKQQKSRDDKDEGLRVAQVDIKARLNKVNSDLRELKARLKTKEEHVRARRNLSKRAMAAEKELSVKIEKAKEELRAKEEQAAVRRAKKDGMREKWGMKQKADFEQREARRTERSRQDAEGDDGMKPASVGAAMANAYEDDFDIDIYGD